MHWIDDLDRDELRKVISLARDRLREKSKKATIEIYIAEVDGAEEFASTDYEEAFDALHALMESERPYALGHEFKILRLVKTPAEADEYINLINRRSLSSIIKYSDLAGLKKLVKKKDLVGGGCD